MRSLARKCEHNGPYDTAYAVPFTTIQVGPIWGGRALNIMPDHCYFDFEIRRLPEDPADSLLQTIFEYSQAMQASMSTVSVHATLR